MDAAKPPSCYLVPVGALPIDPTSSVRVAALALPGQTEFVQ
jgi:hypothetical protein